MADWAPKLDVYELGATDRRASRALDLWLMLSCECFDDCHMAFMYGM